MNYISEYILERTEYSICNRRSQFFSSCYVYVTVWNPHANYIIPLQEAMDEDFT